MEEVPENDGFEEDKRLTIPVSMTLSPLYCGLLVRVTKSQA